MEKSILKSKTFWVNFVALVAMLFPSIQEVVAEHLGETGSAWALINIVLRLVSKDKVYLV